METFEAGRNCCWTGNELRNGDRGMKCTSCSKVMTLDAWNQKRKCPMGHTNAVPAIAENSSRVTLNNTSRIGTQLNWQNSIDNTFYTTPHRRISNSVTRSSYTNNSRDRIPSWLVSLFKFCVYTFSTLISAIFYPPIFNSITEILSGIFSPVEALNNKVEWSFTDLLLYLLQFPVAFIWVLFGISMFIVVCVLVSQGILAFSSWVFDGNTLRSGNRPVKYLGLLAALLAILLGLNWYVDTLKNLNFEPKQNEVSTFQSAKTSNNSIHRDAHIEVSTSVRNPSKNLSPRQRSTPRKTSESSTSGAIDLSVGESSSSRTTSGSSTSGGITVPGRYTPGKTSGTTSSRVSKNWSFPLPRCGSNNPSGIQTFYPVFVNKTDDRTLRYIKSNYCNDAFIKYRESVDRQSIQVASFRSESQARELAQIMIDDPNINSGEVGDPTLR